MEFIKEEILNLVKKKMREQGGFTRDAYKQYIQETIDYFISKGKLSDQENLELIEDNLMDMWEQVREELGD